MLEGTVDFGASDGPMSDENLAKAPGRILHVPTVAGADVVTYNLPGAPQLRLDGRSIADIFLGKITKWNDPRLARQNPAVALPDWDIVVVHRADGSGTTYILADYLSSVSPEWEKQVGRGTAVKWPVGLGAKGNEGVTAQVKQMPGAIGYVELVYAAQNHLPFAGVKNAAGNYVAPSIASVTAALETAGHSRRISAFRWSIRRGRWPIRSRGRPGCWSIKSRATRPRARRSWSSSSGRCGTGEQMAPALNYAPLPEESEQAGAGGNRIEIKY